MKKNIYIINNALKTTVYKQIDVEYLTTIFA